MPQILCALGKRWLWLFQLVPFQRVPILMIDIRSFIFLRQHLVLLANANATVPTLPRLATFGMVSFLLVIARQQASPLRCNTAQSVVFSRSTLARSL